MCLGWWSRSRPNLIRHLGEFIRCALHRNESPRPHTHLTPTILGPAGTLHQQSQTNRTQGASCTRAWAWFPAMSLWAIRPASRPAMANPGPWLARAPWCEPTPKLPDLTGDLLGGLSHQQSVYPSTVAWIGLPGLLDTLYI